MNNKDELRKKQKQIRIKKQQDNNEIIDCGCGWSGKYMSYHYHINKSKKHLKWLEKQDETKEVVNDNPIIEEKPKPIEYKMKQSSIDYLNEEYGFDIDLYN